MNVVLSRSPFLKSVLVLVSGTALAQMLPILAMPVLGRLFTPGDFGSLGLFTAFVTVASAALTLSFQLAIVSNVSDRIAAQLAILGLFALVPMSLVSIMGLLVLRQNNFLGFNALQLVDIVWAWLTLLAIGTFSVFRYWQVRKHDFGSVSRSTISQSVGRVLAQLGAGLLSMGGGGLILAEAIGRWSGVSLLAKLSFRDVMLHSAKTDAREYFSVAKDFRKFPLLNMPSSVLNNLGTALLIPLIAAKYGLPASGQFTMGYRVLTLPVAVISSAVADVFHAQLVRAAQKGMSHARKLFLVVSSGLFLLGLFPSLVVMIWGEPLFHLVLGEQWSQAGIIAAGLMPWLLGSFAVSPVSRVVMVFRGQELKLIYDVLNILGVVGVVTIGSRSDWEIETTAAVLGWTQAAAYLAYFFLLWRILKMRSTAELDVGIEHDDYSK